jgi:uncharacterized integral membrane protein
VTQVVVLLALVFSILIAVFAVQNTTPVAVTYLTFHSDSAAVSVLVLIAAALGAAIMLLLGIWRELTIRWRFRAVTQQLKAAQARIAQLEAGGSQPSAPGAAPGATQELPSPAAQPHGATTNG